MINHIRSTATQVCVAVSLAVSMASVVVAARLTGTTTEQAARRLGRRDRGALTLEQAIITGALAAGALLVTGLIIAAINSHTGNIK